MASLFTDEVPTVSTGTLPWELGVRITIAVAGQLTSLRFWKLARDIGPHIGHLWMPDGSVVSTTFINETAEGWQEQTLDRPVAVVAGTTITVSVASLGHYPVGLNDMLTATVNNDLSAKALGASYGQPGKRPTLPSPHNYFRDIGFTPTLSSQFCALIVGE